MVALRDGSLRELVVGMDEQAHGVDHQADGAGGIEPEGLVADDGHLGHLLHEILGDEGDDGIGAHEDGNLFLRDAGVDEFSDGLRQTSEHVVLIVFAGQQFNADETLITTMFWNLLHHIGIGLGQLGCLGIAALLQVQVFELGRLLEEEVVEGDDAPL